MRRKKLLFLLFILLANIPALAQLDTAWVRRYTTNFDDVARAIVVDRSGNVYVTGQSRASTTFYDYATIKYSSHGDTVWLRRYDGGGSGGDYAFALVVDDSEYVYVTGRSGGSVTSDDYATIKYTPDGDTLWVRRYNGPGNSDDYALDMALDDSGNVYVTGSSTGSGTGRDYATIKYTANGDTTWVRRYNGPGDSTDGAYALAVDKSYNVYVTGFSMGAGTSLDYATIKYSPNGNILWVRRYNGPGNDWDEAHDLVVDDSSSVYITGQSRGNGTSFDYATIKYASNGDTLWVRRYTGNYWDAAKALTVDDSGNLYVTGFSIDSITSHDYATIKYAPDGESLWVRRYNGPGNFDDRAMALALDSSGNVYVTGQSYGTTTYYDYATIKYSPKGDTLWVRRYNGPANNWDEAYSLAVDESGNVYVTGSSTGGEGELTYDYASLKYVQFFCLAKSGDANGDYQILLSDIVSIINFLFKGQGAPNPICRGDANADGNIMLSDIIYLVNFLFKSSAPPLKNRECCL